MATKKKSWKLQDFVAHGADVKCLGLGHKSGRVMVTGGDDHKVNLWSVGKPECILSLTGHTASVEAVRFKSDEEMVIAGSLSGVLKVWDLEQAKTLRTMTGHKARISSLDFHPYGNYVASGSEDCCVKLWDIRCKDCIYTYKSHTMCVNCLRFTPDGQWLASASDDSTVKIWNLTAGKLLTELRLHKEAVNVVEFHPSDLLLASGSSDRTVKFWDLESFQCVSSSDVDKQPIRCMHFHPEGSCLYTSCGATLKVYGWEPLICHDIVPVRWSQVTDMAVTNSQLIAATFSGRNISTYVVDLSKVAPTGATSKSENVREALQSSSNRRSFIVDRPQPASSSRRVSEPTCSEIVSDRQDRSNEEDQVSGPDVHVQDVFLKVLKEKTINSSKRDRTEPFQSPSQEDDPEQVKVQVCRPASERKDTSPPVKAVSHQQRSRSESAEREVKELLTSGHATMVTVLQQRSQNLQIVVGMWRSGNTKTAVQLAISMKDPAVMVDLLNTINTRITVWSLDLCSLLLPQLEDLMGSKYESHMTTAGNSLKLIMRNFNDVIKTNLQEPSSSFVDISREERRKKCLDCYTVLISIKELIRLSQPTATTKQASMHREIMLLLAGLD